MKKNRLILCLILTLACTFAYTQSASYMYVDSPEGLKVRDKAGLDGTRISGLTHLQKVKVAEKGAKATIDGIASNWIKIEIPSTEWTSNKPSYGWVFGGYLKSVRNEPSAIKSESIYVPSVKNTRPIKLDVNPDYVPVKRKDFEPEAGKKLSNYAISTSFGVKLFLKQGMEYVWFETLPPFTNIIINESLDTKYYKTTWCNTECFVQKSDVIKGAVSGFALDETTIYSAADTAKDSGKKYSPRQFIAITDLSNRDFAKTNEGYVLKSDIWTYQKDVLILQAFQRDLEVLAMNDKEILKNETLNAMLLRSTDYRDTNLFFLEREALTRAWNVTHNLVKYTKVITEGMKDCFKDASELEKYFSDSVKYCYGNVLPCCGNYISNKMYTGIISITDDKYNSAFYYDRTIKSIMPLQVYLDRYDSNAKLALDLNLVNRAYEAKTDEECKKIISMITCHDIKKRFDLYLGYDRTNKIEEVFEYSPVKKDMVLHTKEKIEVRANPGLRYKVIGYLEEGYKFNPTKFTTFGIKGWGASDYFVEFLYIENAKIKGWIRASQVYRSDDQTAGYDYSVDMENDFNGAGYNSVERCTAKCKAYSLCGEAIPLFAGEDEVKSYEPAGKPKFISDKSIEPIGYIPNGTEVDADAEIVLMTWSGNDSFPEYTLYHVTYNGISGWLAPENCITCEKDNAVRKNDFDAWVDYMK